MKLNGKLVILLILVVLGLGAYGFSTILLPPYVSGQVESQFKEKLQPKELDMRLESAPAAKLALGTIDHFRGTMTDVQLGDLNFNTFKFDLMNMEISPFKLFQRQVVITNIGRGEVEGVVKQADLQAFMEKSVKGLEVSKVDITSKGISLQGTINIGGFLTGKVDIEGVLELKGNTLQFSPQKFAINGSGIGGLNTAVLKAITIYDFANFPIPVKAERIESVNGEIHVFVQPIAE